MLMHSGILNRALQQKVMQQRMGKPITPYNLDKDPFMGGGNMVADAVEGTLNTQQPMMGQDQAMNPNILQMLGQRLGGLRR